MVMEDQKRFDVELVSRFEILISSKEKRCTSSLVCRVQDVYGWDSRTNKLMEEYHQAIKIISTKIGEPSYSDIGPANSHYSHFLQIRPDDYSRLLYVSFWKFKLATIYLTVSTHDADSLRCLNLEVIKSQI